MNILCRLFALLTLTVALGTTGAAIAGDERKASNGQTNDAELNDAWLKGKVEMALLLNRHLNSFKIDTSVDSSVVTLSGDVKSEVAMDLAEQIALGVDGVSTVENELIVAPEKEQQASSDQEQERKFLQRIEDLTTTARIRSKLAMNQNIAARNIAVDTTNTVVTLEGNVNDSQERDLVVQITKNTGPVTEVKDKLEITGRQANR